MKIIFTKHARERMHKRGFLEQDIFLAIQTPDIIIKQFDKHIFVKRINQRNWEIVCEVDKIGKNIKIITVY